MDKIYGAKLKAEGVVTDTDIKFWETEYSTTLNQHFELAKKVTKLSIMDWIDSPWTGFFEARDPKKVRYRIIIRNSPPRISDPLFPVTKFTRVEIKGTSSHLSFLWSHIAWLFSSCNRISEHIPTLLNTILSIMQ